MAPASLYIRAIFPFDLAHVYIAAALSYINRRAPFLFGFSKFPGPLGVVSLFGGVERGVQLSIVTGVIAIW